MLDYEKKAEKKGYRSIIGIDEAGRGPLAGPVVASAVHLKSRNFLAKIDDSKKLNARQREKAFIEIYEKAFVGIGVVSETVIDSTNILDATFRAMTLAVHDLLKHLPKSLKGAKNFSKKVCLLIDGPYFRSDLPFHIQTIVKGDSLSLSIACASIVAKVTRDRILNIYDKVFPGYGFAKHKGYPTNEHRKAIQKLGPSVIHRKTFHLGS